jgi:putative ABC transport system ATP-binding protein
MRTNKAAGKMTELTNEVAIRTDRVSRSYQMGDALVHAVDDVTVAIRTKEFVALLGSSGSGKSTLLNLMAGLDRPTSGAIFAHGRNLAEMSSEDLAQHRNQTVGMVFQAFNLLPRMTLEENVELPLRLAEVNRDERPNPCSRKSPHNFTGRRAHRKSRQRYRRRHPSSLAGNQ